MQLTGNVTGAGGLTKSGPGTLVLNQVSFRNSYSNPFPPFNFVNNSGGSYATYGGTTTVTEGVLALDASHNLWNSFFGPPSVSGQQAVPGPLTITGGTVQYLRNDQLGSSLITVAGGTLDLNTRFDNVGPVLLASGSISGTTGTLYATSYEVQSGSVTAKLGGGAHLTKSTSGTVVLSGQGSYTGSTFVNGGTLQLGNSSVLPDGTNVYVTGSGSALDMNNNVDDVRSLSVDGGSVSAGRLSVAQNIYATSGTVSAELTGLAGLQKSTAGLLVLSGQNTYLGGTFVHGGTLRLGSNHALPASGSVFVGGTLDVNGRTNSVDFINLAPGGSILLPPGSDLEVTGVASMAGDVSIDGILRGPDLRVTGEGLMEGSGTLIGQLNLLSGGTVSPGNSPGTMTVVGSATWAGGANYLFEINDTLGTSGADPGWDLLDATGTLTITASAGNEFTLDVDSLLLTNTPGDAANFNPGSNYAWTFASAAGGVVGFDPLAFLLDLSGFSNPYTGVFSVALLGNDLNLVYTAPAAVPEPGTLVMWSVLGLGGAVAYRRRLRKQAQPPEKAG